MRILLLFPGALGDVVLLAPGVDVRARTARVELSVRRAVATIVPGLAPVVLGPPADGAAVSSLFTRQVAPSLAAWLRGADEVHLWFGRDRDGLKARIAAVGARHVYCHAVHRDDGPEHVARDYATDLGIVGPIPPPRLLLETAASAPTWTAPAGARLVVHPGAGAVAKRWPAARFLATADAWRARGGEVTVLLGPAERDLIARWRISPYRVASDLDLATAASVVASAPRYLGNDSGISHLAGALARDGIVLFGPTRPERWRPRGGRLRALPFETDVATIARLLGAPATAGLP